MKTKQSKAERKKGGRPPRCFAIHIAHLESLGHHDEKITQRDSRAKARLQARQDKIRQTIIDGEHVVALRDDLARTIRGLRREEPDGRRKATRLLRTWHRRQRGEPLSRREEIEQDQQEHARQAPHRRVA